MPGCPSACRERASRCTELAQKAKDSQLKDVLEMLAQRWSDLAAQLDRAEALRNARATPNRPSTRIGLATTHAEGAS